MWMGPKEGVGKDDQVMFVYTKFVKDMENYISKSRRIKGYHRQYKGEGQRWLEGKRFPRWSKSASIMWVKSKGWDKATVEDSKTSERTGWYDIRLYPGQASM